MSDQKFNETVLDDPLFACRAEGTEAIMMYFSKSISVQTEKGIIIGIPFDKAREVSRALAEIILKATLEQQQAEKIAN